MISSDETARLQALGDEVCDVLTRAGLPTFFQRDFHEPPESSPGAHVGIDPTMAGQVSVHWEYGDELKIAALAESKLGVFTGQPSSSPARWHTGWRTRWSRSFKRLITRPD